MSLGYCRRPLPLQASGLQLMKNVPVFVRPPPSDLHNFLSSLHVSAMIPLHVDGTAYHVTRSTRNFARDNSDMYMYFYAIIMESPLTHAHTTRNFFTQYRRTVYSDYTTLPRDLVPKLLQIFQICRPTSIDDFLHLHFLTSIAKVLFMLDVSR